MKFSLDTETSGLDLRHGALPFLVTMCGECQDPLYWEWDVDPFTRKPIIPSGDLDEIQEQIDEADELVIQNSKFDMPFLKELYKKNGKRLRWDWSKVKDTLISGHLLASNAPHDLTTMALVYLGVNIRPYEDALEEIVKDARTLARSKHFIEKHGQWRIAKEGLPDMPSAKKETWKFDMWLPRAIAKAEGYLDDHPWWTACSNYANHDSLVTLPLDEVHQQKIREKGLVEIYETRMAVIPVVVETEEIGVPVYEDHIDVLCQDYEEVVETCRKKCVNLSGGEIETLPVNGASNALRHVLFDVFKLETSVKTKSGGDSTNKAALDAWLDELPSNSKARRFILQLRGYRQRKTAISYMQSYRRFGVKTKEKGRIIIYPSLNPTGTDTLRWSSSNPNEQNISKQGMPCINCRGVGCEICDDLGEDKRTIRYCFGPLPGREWWSMDYENIELRIPAYESGEEVMIELFEKPDEPPYFGSYHLLNASIVYPEIFWPLAEEKGAFKKKYAATYYQWDKNGGFAIQYGCQEKKADATFKRKGAFKAIKEKMPKVTKLNDHYVAMANKHGFVETLPDRSINSKRGYPIYCSRTKWGCVKPTVPLNYHVQSTAMWCTMKAMIRCHEFLKKHPGCNIVLQVHDEIVFDLPARGKKNLPIVNELKRLMEMSGEDIGIPLKVSCSYHPHNWSEETKL